MLQGRAGVEPPVKGNGIGRIESEAVGPVLRNRSVVRSIVRFILDLRIVSAPKVALRQRHVTAPGVVDVEREIVGEPLPQRCLPSMISAEVRGISEIRLKYGCHRANPGNSVSQIEGV